MRIGGKNTTETLKILTCEFEQIDKFKYLRSIIDTAG